MGAAEFQREFSIVPIIQKGELAAADAVIFGKTTRFWNMCGQMHQSFDSTGALWKENALAGKVGRVFTSSRTQHGGQESTILSMHTTLLHHGMNIPGLPYSFSRQSRTDETAGCSPYETSNIACAANERWPSENERAGARYQGKYISPYQEGARGEKKGYWPLWNQLNAVGENYG
jgi:NAD(P)H dehydrogenase (quinone)